MNRRWRHRPVDPVQLAISTSLAARRREQFELYVVRVAEHQDVPVRRVVDWRLRHVERLEMALPPLELGTGRDAEADVIEPGPALAKPLGLVRIVAVEHDDEPPL